MPSLTVAARPSVAPLFWLMPEARRGRGAGRRRGRRRSRAAIRRAMLLPNSFQSALTAWRAGVPERWGYRTDWRRLLLTRAIDRAAGRPPSDRVLPAPRAALGFRERTRRQPRIDVAPALREAGADALREAGWDGRDAARGDCARRGVWRRRSAGRRRRSRSCGARCRRGRRRDGDGRQPPRIARRPPRSKRAVSGRGTSFSISWAPTCRRWPACW